MRPLICWRFHVFQSTPSLRKATTLRAALTDLPEAFQSTPSLRKATCREQENNSDRAISIHTFLAEGDAGEAVSLRNSHISIHTFLAEGDKDWGAKEEDEEYFNPHLPCGRRLPPVLSSLHTAYFNPHLPCGRRLAIILTLRLY